MRKLKLRPSLYLEPYKVYSFIIHGGFIDLYFNAEYIEALAHGKLVKFRAKGEWFNILAINASRLINRLNKKHLSSNG